jgi:hypothetical protein
MASRNERDQHHAPREAEHTLYSRDTWRGGGEFGMGQFDARLDRGLEREADDDEQRQRRQGQQAVGQRRDARPRGRGTQDDRPLGRATAQGDDGLYELRGGLASYSHRDQRYGEQQRDLRDDDQRSWFGGDRDDGQDRDRDREWFGRDHDEHRDDDRPSSTGRADDDRDRNRRFMSRDDHRGYMSRDDHQGRDRGFMSRDRQSPDRGYTTRDDHQSRDRNNGGRDVTDRARHSRRPGPDDHPLSRVRGWYGRDDVRDEDRTWADRMFGPGARQGRDISRQELRSLGRHRPSHDREEDDREHRGFIDRVRDWVGISDRDDDRDDDRHHMRDRDEHLRRMRDRDDDRRYVRDHEHDRDDRSFMDRVRTFVGIGDHDDDDAREANERGIHGRGHRDFDDDRYRGRSSYDMRGGSRDIDRDVLRDRVRAEERESGSIFRGSRDADDRAGWYQSHQDVGRGYTRDRVDDDDHHRVRGQREWNMGERRDIDRNIHRDPGRDHRYGADSHHVGNAMNRGFSGRRYTNTRFEDEGLRGGGLYRDSQRGRGDVDRETRGIGDRDNRGQQFVSYNDGDDMRGQFRRSREDGELGRRGRYMPDDSRGDRSRGRRG